MKRAKNKMQGEVNNLAGKVGVLEDEKDEEKEKIAELERKMVKLNEEREAERQQFNLDFLEMRMQLELDLSSKLEEARLRNKEDWNQTIDHVIALFASLKKNWW